MSRIKTEPQGRLELETYGEVQCEKKLSQEKTKKQTENSKGPRVEKVTKKRSTVKSVPKQRHK